MQQFNKYLEVFKHPLYFGGHKWSFKSPLSGKNLFSLLGQRKFLKWYMLMEIQEPEIVDRKTRFSSRHFMSE
jgi:hypothetical protein